MVEIFVAHNREKVELCLAHLGIVVHNNREEMVEFFVAHNGMIVHNSEKVESCTWHTMA